MATGSQEPIWQQPCPAPMRGAWVPAARRHRTDEEVANHDIRDAMEANRETRSFLLALVSMVLSVLLGLAIGAVYYPLFLLPLWLGFYWQRGAAWQPG
ncbi:MAG: hypothetical protein DYG91_14285 [Chloroflexi bacterium CFX7]|nr:hypothetical protein [Chloroflexi bacterium CFX7]